MSFKEEEIVLEQTTLYPGLESSPAAAVHLGGGGQNPLIVLLLDVSIELRSLEV